LGKLKALAIIQQSSNKRQFAGLAVAATAFAALGTVAALWENPLFVRMTPAGGWEISLLAFLSVLTGLYVVIRRPFCSNKAVGAAGVLGFVGVACPICNKILLLAFGSELLLVYFEPVRIYATILGVVIAAWVVLREWRYRNTASLT
jgi:hypothetical protein